MDDDLRDRVRLDGVVSHPWWSRVDINAVGQIFGFCGAFETVFSVYFVNVVKEV